MPKFRVGPAEAFYLDNCCNSHARVSCSGLLLDSQLRGFMPLGPGFAHEELRSLAVERIADDRLPVWVPKRVYAGYGSGERCDLCMQPIEREQAAYEADDYRHALVFHVTCYAVWQLECTSRLSSEELATSP